MWVCDYGHNTVTTNGGDIYPPLSLLPTTVDRTAMSPIDLHPTSSDDVATHMHSSTNSSHLYPQQRNHLQAEVCRAAAGIAVG